MPGKRRRHRNQRTSREVRRKRARNLDRKPRRVPQDAPVVLDAGLRTAISSPLRLHIISEASKRSLTPAEVAGECELPLEKVSYHFRALEDCGCLVATETVPRRGAQSTVFRASKQLHWFSVALDEQGWKAATDLLDKVMRDIDEVEIDAAQRLVESGEEGFRASFALGWCERLDPRPGAPRKKRKR